MENVKYVLNNDIYSFGYAEQDKINKLYESVDKVIQLDSVIIHNNVGEGNIGHYFHECLTPLYIEYSSVFKNYKIFYLNKNYNSFTIGIINALIDKEDLIKQDPNVLYKLTNSIIPNIGNREQYFGSRQSQVQYIWKQIRKKCREYYNIMPSKNNDKIILYDRSDLEYKNLKNININFLHQNNINLVKTLSSLSFEEALQLFIDTKVFIYAGGSSSINILFMNGNTKAIEINPSEPNSWPRRYGLANFIDRFREIVEIRKLYLINKKTENEKEPKLNNHIVWSAALEKNLYDEIN